MTLKSLKLFISMIIVILLLSSCSLKCDQLATNWLDNDPGIWAGERGYVTYQTSEDPLKVHCQAALMHADRLWLIDKDGMLTGFPDLKPLGPLTFIPESEGRRYVGTNNWPYKKLIKTTLRPGEKIVIKSNKLVK